MSNRNEERGKLESISKSHIFDCRKETLQLKTRRRFINLSRAFPFERFFYINFSINIGLTVVRVKMDCTWLGFFTLMDFYIWQNELNMDLVDFTSKNNNKNYVRIPV